VAGRRALSSSSKRHMTAFHRADGAAPTSGGMNASAALTTMTVSIHSPLLGPLSDGNLDDETTPAVVRTLGPDAPSVALDDLPTDGQAKTEPEGLMGFCDLVEPFEDALAIFRSDTDPMIADGDLRHARAG